MTPYGKALLDYHHHVDGVHFLLRRDDGFTETVPAQIFFDDAHFSELEQRALVLCRGSVLDVGAGAGRHALELQRRGLTVHAIDILPEAVLVMKERGVQETLLGDVFDLENLTFDTLLMLMNGIGLVGSPSRLDDFLTHARRVVAETGRIICDSLDVSKTTNPIHVRYREKNIREERYPGQQVFTAAYGNEVGAPFPWLHLDFPTLKAHAQRNHWVAELVFSHEDGRYLAMLNKMPFDD